MAILTNSKYSTLESQTSHSYSMPEPDYYIYFYHVGKYLTLPTYPDNISDTMTSSYSSTTPLGRSAPIQSYSGSGPRQLSFTFNLHRDMMWQLNYANSSIDLAGYNGDDYVDLMTKWILAAVLPEYSTSDKMVSPPMIAVKIGNEVFIKGVVTSAGVTYQPPILRTGQYASILINFTVIEVVPYSASIVMQLGSYRDLDYSLGTNEVYTVGSVEKNALSRKIDVGDGKTVEITSDSAAIQAAYFARGNIGAEGTDGG